jgi:hypothetical protein
MIASVVIVLVVLGHVASTLAQHDLSRTQRSRSEALRVAGQFLERLRADDDWAGLYARLRTAQSAVATNGIAGATLTDGRRTYALTTYYSDFAAPSDVTAIVEVPRDADAITPSLQVLREDMSHPDFLLPADLNGDGTIDDRSHDADYVFLPVRVTFRWPHPGQEGGEQFTSVSWLRGDR